MDKPRVKLSSILKKTLTPKHILDYYLQNK